jgi:hypothetical protein
MEIVNQIFRMHLKSSSHGQGCVDQDKIFNTFEMGGSWYLSNFVTKKVGLGQLLEIILNIQQQVILIIHRVYKSII